MRSDAPRVTCQRARLMFVHPLHVGVIQLVIAIIGYLTLGVLGVCAWSPVELVLSMVGGLASGVLAALVFDLVAPRFGGLAIELVTEPPDQVERKACPQCGAQVRAGRSFCPACDHSFAPPA